jgi:glycine cleavage system H protein
MDAPGSINEDPYGSWFMRVEFTEAEELLDAAAYEAHCSEEA